MESNGLQATPSHTMLDLFSIEADLGKIPQLSVSSINIALYMVKISVKIKRLGRRQLKIASKTNFIPQSQSVPSNYPAVLSGSI